VLNLAVFVVCISYGIDTTFGLFFTQASIRGNEMKILVFAQQLVVGGTPLNGIELAAALRDLHGHEVVLFATPGPMIELVKEKNLRFLPAPEVHVHPSLKKIRALREAVRCERPDVIHAWEWSQFLDAYYGVHLPMRVPMVVTDMLMNVNRVLPKWLPTTFGTPELVDKAREAGRRRVELLLPPVDVHQNAPGTVDPRPFCERYGIVDGNITLVTVSRLDPWMKSESLVRTIDVVRKLGRTIPLQFVIVGSGGAQAKLERLAGETNTELGRSAVVLTGELLDPRPAYAAADIIVGMGGAALRGMAFSKPVIIVGEQGFSAPLTPETAEFFYYNGIYGRGDGNVSNERLVADIKALAEHPERLLELGEFSRQFVVQHFSLETVSEKLAGYLSAAAAEMPQLHIAAADGLRTAAMYLRDRVFLWRSIAPGQNRELRGKA
jgi:L-malate glycosyltransferase